MERDCRRFGQNRADVFQVVNSRKLGDSLSSLEPVKEKKAGIWRRKKVSESANDSKGK
jgi:hypothetical protein